MRFKDFLDESWLGNLFKSKPAEPVVKTVKIFDLDAFDKMGQIEGERWMKMQKMRQDDEHGFFAHQKAWIQIRMHSLMGKMTTGEVLAKGMVPGVFSKGSNVIYGDGGYTRYSVKGDGTLSFSASHARPEKLEKARELGFEIS